MAGLAAILVVVTVVACGVGAFAIAPGDVLRIGLHALGLGGNEGFSAEQQQVLTSIRLPRVLLALTVGAGLGIAGAAMQALFRNPLADPSLIGVSGGAALAAATVIVMGATWFPGLARSLGVAT